MLTSADLYEKNGKKRLIIKSFPAKSAHVWRDREGASLAEIIKSNSLKNILYGDVEFKIYNEIVYPKRSKNGNYFYSHDFKNSKTNDDSNSDDASDSMFETDDDHEILNESSGHKGAKHLFSDMKELKLNIFDKENHNIVIYNPKISIEYITNFRFNCKRRLDVFVEFDDCNPKSFLREMNGFFCIEVLFNHENDAKKNKQLHENGINCFLLDVNKWKKSLIYEMENPKEFDPYSDDYLNYKKFILKYYLKDGINVTHIVKPTPRYILDSYIKEIEVLNAELKRKISILQNENYSLEKQKINIEQNNEELVQYSNLKNRELNQNIKKLKEKDLDIKKLEEQNKTLIIKYRDIVDYINTNEFSQIRKKNRIIDFCYDENDSLKVHYIPRNGKIKIIKS